MAANLKVRAADPVVVATLAQQLELPKFVASILASRGITTVDQAQAFFTPSLERDWLNPYDIPGLAEVVDGLEEAVRARRKIVVFGDFDVDGVSATAVLTRGLRELGANATPIIPRRFEEGYGLSLKAYERIKPLDPELIITVDCGIACAEEIAEIMADGVQVIVTDHHEPPEILPKALAVCDPKTDPNCPSITLAGVGVALKVIQALGARFGFPHLWRTYTDLATLGTVADLMPMRGENRALVADGLRRINTDPRPAIAALLGQAGASGKEITSTELSFSVIPRLNAAGRLGDASIALDLLLTDDFETACQLSVNLESTNDTRRSIEAELSEMANDQAARVFKGQRALIVAGEGWHEGVKGIVASRLVNTYGVPCILFSIVDGEARGSGRTVGQVNLLKAVESTSDLLIRYGGHGAALGVTLPADKLEEFTHRLCDYLDALPADDFLPQVEVDACVSLEELSLENVETLQKLAPFGQENRVPCLLAPDVSIAGAKAVGADKNHLSCSLTDGRETVAAIMFHCADIEKLINTTSLINATFEVQIDQWRGRKNVKAMLKSLEPTQSCAALEACLDPHHRQFVSQLFSASDEELCETREDCPIALHASLEEQENNREIWSLRAQSEPGRLQADIVRALIGDGQLHEKQKEVLDALEQGKSTFCVMATGRGKSLIFQVHAARIALSRGAVSLFVYPLRALIADQAYHLSRTLSQFGIVASVLTGETPPEEREEIYKAVDAGQCDILLTTPEYLSIHADRIGSSGRIGFLVVDEAHHVGQAKAGNRLEYKELGRIYEDLGRPTVLALTATANKEVAEDIAAVLPFQCRIYDSTSRPNLSLDDHRGLKNRDDYLASLVASGEKTVIYVNSRMGSVQLARTLRQKVPHLALMIGFYNAGLSRNERARVEEMFRTGHFSVLIATSAFGEGVNIPDIRHVVLYHLPYNEIEFNQMSGRAGRDGSPAGVHLLFTRKDGEINEGILNDATPERKRMIQIYKALREAQKELAADGSFFPMSNGEAAARASKLGEEVAQDSVECAVAVFRELGLIETRNTYASGQVTRLVRVVPGAEKVDLESSVRYREGLDEQTAFRNFKDWALRESAEALHGRIIRPILPI